MTTLEKLCRAACEADGGPRFVDPELIAQASAPYRKIVLAVLSALEDPSDEMVVAFQEATVNQWATIAGLKKGFTTMIRKAKEG